MEAGGEAGNMASKRHLSPSTILSLPHWLVMYGREQYVAEKWAFRLCFEALFNTIRFAGLLSQVVLLVPSLPNRAPLYTPLLVEQEQA